MSNIFFDINFATLYNLIWSPIFIFSIISVFIFYKKSSFYSKILTGKNSWLLQSYSILKLKIKTLFIILGLISIFIAFLSPQWGKKEKITPNEGRELFIALDISRSMLCQDVLPSRIAFAKSKIKKMISLMSADRVGLVLFSGSAFVYCPLTKDKLAFEHFLNDVDVETISSGSTSIAKALSIIIESFKNMQLKKNKVVILFTDGEDFSSGMAEIKKEAINLGLRIFTYGVGTTEGAPIPLFDSNKKNIGHQKDSQNNIIFSRLNEGILKSLSSESGAKYISATNSDDDLKSIIHIVESLEKEKFEDSKMILQEDRYYYFVAFSFLMFLIEWLI